MTPHEIIMGKKPTLPHVPRFGSKAYVQKPKRETKFEERVDVGKYVELTARNEWH